MSYIHMNVGIMPVCLTTPEVHTSRRKLTRTQHEAGKTKVHTITMTNHYTLAITGPTSMYYKMGLRLID